jgi:toxin ParE1/3/4
MTSSRNVSLSPLAERDLLFVLQHSLETWGEQRRDTYAGAMGAAFADIERFPGIGRSRDDVALGCRGLPVQQHVIYYRVEEHTVRVLRILHARMDAKGRLEAPDPP